MRYFVVTAIILVATLGASVAIEPDEALAFADHRLTEIGRMSGNPYFLIQARNRIHAVRYARASLYEPISLRIRRKDEPPRIAPAPTRVVNPSRYQYGSPMRGVLPPDAPNAPIDAALVEYSEDFEFKFAGNVNRDYAIGWTGYTAWGQPTSDGEFTTRHSGDWAQKISGHATFRGGIWKQFTTAVNTQYSVRVWSHLYVLGGGAAHIGVDPYGGTDPNASTVVWYPQMTTLGQWMEMQASGQALGPQITVFLEGYSLFDDNTNAYFDDFNVQVFQEI